MRPAAWAAALLLPATALGLEARLLGEPLRLDLTESAYASWRGDPGNGDASSAHYGEFVSRLNVQAAWRRWVFSTRLDSSGYVSAPEVGETLTSANARPGTQPFPVPAFRLKDRYRQSPLDPWKGVEKLSLSYQGRALEATLGDFYANFGRGLVLSVRKVDELGQDTSLLGGKATVRAGPFTGTVLGGVSNQQNLDEATARYTEDSLDRMAGARAEVRLFDKASVGVHGLYGQPSRNFSLSAKEPDRTGRYGLTIDAPRPVDWLALYAEGALKRDRVTDAARDGLALYGSATAFLGAWTLLAEAKHYDAYTPWRATNDPFGALVYQQPPTLERVVTQLSNNTDITAGRLRADWTIKPGRVLFAAAEYGRIRIDPERNVRLVDFYVGTQRRGGAGGHAFPLVGYREERSVETGELRERVVAFEGVVAQPLDDRWSVEAQWLMWRRSESNIPEDWTEGQAYLALKRVPNLILAAGYEFNTSPTEQLNRQHFFNGAATWNITTSTSLKLFGGGMRPGLKCVSGVCRVFPAFTGARLELVIRG
jgi:hypothetical protein